MSKRQAILTLLLITMLMLGAGTIMAATRTVIIRVQGMTCDGCATSVENALKSTDGVEQARVNFKSGKAVIKYNDQKVTISRLREVIHNTGFFCDVEGAPEKKSRRGLLR